MCASLIRFPFVPTVFDGDVCVRRPPIATVEPWKTSTLSSIRTFPAVEGHGVAMVGTGGEWIHACDVERRADLDAVPEQEVAARVKGRDDVIGVPRRRVAGRVEPVEDARRYGLGRPDDHRNLGTDRVCHRGCPGTGRIRNAACGVDDPRGPMPVTRRREPPPSAVSLGREASGVLMNGDDATQVGNGIRPGEADRRRLRIQEATRAGVRVVCVG